MPLVIRTALDEKNPALLSAFDHYFSMVVSREPYSSIFLINRAGDVVACDDPRRLYHPYARDVVSKKPDALKGFAGKPSIGDTLLSVASARPLVPPDRARVARGTGRGHPEDGYRYGPSQWRTGVVAAPGKQREGLCFRPFSAFGFARGKPTPGAVPPGALCTATRPAAGCIS